MRFNKGQRLSISELGGPHGSWEYTQAHVLVLRDFNSDDEARAFIKAGVYQDTHESMECQFIRWLRSRQYLELCEPEDRQWNVSTTLGQWNKGARTEAFR